MLERLRRRTMGPSQRLSDPDRVWLIVFSLAAVGSGIYLAIRFTFG